MSELIKRHAVDFPAPCSPLATRIKKNYNNQYSENAVSAVSAVSESSFI